MAAGERFPRRGSVLLAILMFMVFFAAVSSVIYSLMNSEMKTSMQYARRTAAFYIAEAGIQDALQALSADASWTAGFAGKPFAEGFYTVTVEQGYSPVRLVSRSQVPGVFPGGVAKAAVMVAIKINPDIFDYGVGVVGSIGGKSVTLTNSQLSGDLYAVAGIENTGSTVSGSTAPVTPAPAVPAIDEAGIIASAKAGGTSSGLTLTAYDGGFGPRFINGDFTVQGGSTVTLTGTVYVDGNLTVDSSAIYGKQTICASRNITVTNSVVGSTVPNNSPFICSSVTGHGTDKVSISGSVFNSVIVYAPNIKISMQDTTASGSFVADNFVATGHTPGIDNCSLTWSAGYCPGWISGLKVSVVGGSWGELY